MRIVEPAMISTISSWMRPLVASTLPARERNGPPASVLTRPARFLDDQRAGRDVPGLELRFPEPVEAPGGDIAEVERRRSEPAHGARS